MMRMQAKRTGGWWIVSLLSVTSFVCSRPPDSLDCSGATASETTLWPPNHKYHTISILGGGR